MGLMRYTKNGFLDKYEKENPYVFLRNFILPKEQIDFITNGLSRNSKNSVALDKLEAEIVAGRIVEKLTETKGKIKGNVYSVGGAVTAESEQNEEFKKRNAKVVYTILNIGDIILLEAIGQKNNAMFVGKDSDILGDVLENFGRRGVLDQGFYKICHDPQEENSEKYNVEPLLKVMDMASENPKMFLTILEQLKQEGRKYSYMKTVEGKYYSLAQGDNSISKEDIFESVEALMNKTTKEEKEVGEHE